MMGAGPHSSPRQGSRMKPAVRTGIQAGIVTAVCSRVDGSCIDTGVYPVSVPVSHARVCSAVDRRVAIPGPSHVCFLVFVVNRV